MDEVILDEPEVTPEDAAYAELKNSATLQTLVAEIDTLRQAFIGVDEEKFRRLDNAYQILRMF